MGLKSTIGWLVRGQANTTATLDRLSVDVRDLQQRVDALARAMQQVDRSVHQQIALIRREQLAQFDQVREAVIRATDDLSARIAAVHEPSD